LSDRRNPFAGLGFFEAAHEQIVALGRQQCRRSEPSRANGNAVA
jgi:hypothetical protein